MEPIKPIKKKNGGPLFSISSGITSFKDFLVKKKSLRKVLHIYIFLPAGIHFLPLVLFFSREDKEFFYLFQSTIAFLLYLLGRSFLGLMEFFFFPQNPFLLWVEFLWVLLYIGERMYEVFRIYQEKPIYKEEVFYSFYKRIFFS